MRLLCLASLLILVLSSKSAFGQDVDLYLTGHYLAGKSIIKVNRDFDDAYMWVLGANNDVYRFNTLTKQVDDYSSKFQLFNNYKIFDIAGLGPDWVTLAIKTADSTILVNYHNGVINYPLRNRVNPLWGNITSIGASSTGTESLYQDAAHPVVLIATDRGLWRYSILYDVLIYNGSSASQVYSATYRTQLFVLNNVADTSGANLTPVISTNLGSFSNNPGVIKTGPQFGGGITTAFHTINTLFNSPFYFTPDVFWGNNTGMYQAKLRNSSPFLSPYKQYLTNVKINKIVDIFGLTSFGVNAAKENLLVGTDNGLYYSNSLLKAQPDNNLDSFTLYHFNPLGNIQINFVEVNFTSKFPPLCEDGIWCATDDGIYLIKPDYAGHFNSGKSISAIHFKDQDTSINKTSICAGSEAVIQLNDDVTANAIQWFKDGNAILNENGSKLTATATGDYYAVLYDPCAGVSANSNHLEVQVISSPVFSFNYPDKLQYCDSTQTTLKTDNNPGYHYRWYTNGVLNGDTTHTYTIKQSGKYKVEVSACTSSWAPSKEIEVDLINLPVPAIAADKAKYCAGDRAVLSVNAPTDTSYTINWYKDGNVLAAGQDQTSITVTTDGGYTVMISSKIAACWKASTVQPILFTPAPIFTFNYPAELRYCSGTRVVLKVTGDPKYKYRWYKDGTLTGDTVPALSVTQIGKYKAEVSSCDGSWVPTKEIKVDLISLPVPVINTDKPAYCMGDNAILSVNTPISTNYTINWYSDNNLVSAYTNQTSVTTTNGGSYTVSVVNNQPNSDGTTCSQTSTAQVIVFNPPPTASIQKVIRTTLCDGQTVDLKVSYNIGTVNWSTGQTSDQISVKQSGTYRATVTSAAGCTTQESVDVQFFPNPALNISNAAVCVPSHKTITLTAPIGMASYTWNGQSGTNIYVADHPQTVTLTVTDANGCQATQDIQVVDECPDIRIPNAFTPNGDGINDTWAIIGLEYDPKSMVRVFTRYGQQVYQSKGYGIPWNGESRGKKLPAGAYYYIINTKNGSQTFSGEVTIIY